LGGGSVLPIVSRMKETKTREPDRSPVDPDRLRKPPAHFAWMDHRLREVLGALSLEDIALLFFLHLAADKFGCSFWADSTIGKKLGLPEGEVIQARYRLVAKGLVAYRYPLYQLLPFADQGR
jgi:hypothetical protein